jgi:hypothetical protein
MSPPDCIPPAQSIRADVGSALQSAVIWSASVPPGAQAFVAFRRIFVLDRVPASAQLHLFGDSRYLLWVNGTNVMRGPCRFNPKRPEFDTLDVRPWLRPGTNSLVVLVHSYPAVNGRIMRHAPGLTALLEADGRELLRTDAAWRCYAGTEYQPSPGAWSSIPDVIDGRKSPGDWMSPEFADGAWEPAVPVSGESWGTFQPRSIPLPKEIELPTPKVMPGATPLSLPLELRNEAGRPWSYPGGFTGRWMWPAQPAKKAWFKAVWSNAGFGQGRGSQIKVGCDNAFVLFHNGREIARSADWEHGWTGPLDLADGDVLAIEGEDIETGNHSAGLFVSVVNSGNCILETSRFLGRTTPPPADWTTNADLTGFSPLSPENVHPAHAKPPDAMQSVVLDLGQMTMAYPTIELEADAGSVLQLQYALRFQNGRPAETYGVGTTYTARAGRQSFVAADQWCARYVTVSCLSGRIKLLRLKMTERRYPFERLGRFECSDPLLTRLWDMAVKTIECTSDDAYGSDARERNEWVQDSAKASFNTTRVAEAGPDGPGGKMYSDPRLLRNTLRHAALSQRADGNLLGTFPTDRGPEDCHYIIEDYSLQWVEALRTYYEATGDKNFVREQWPVLVKQMDWFLQRRMPRGLLLAREYNSFDNPLAYITCEGATLNAFFYQALRDAESLALALGEKQTAAGYQQAAADLFAAFNRELWDAPAQAYSAGFLENSRLGPTVHAQLMALHCDLVLPERRAVVQKWFLANYKNPSGFHCGSNPDSARMIAAKAGLGMPIMYYWAFAELYRMDSAAMDLEALNEMRRRWKHMVELQQDAGTLSESFVDEHGQGASESCHNYGAVPAYFLSSYVLGVRCDGPVWEKQLIIEPHLADLTEAQGVVVTEFGPVSVAWRREGRTLRFVLEVPSGVKATLRIPEGDAAALNCSSAATQSKQTGRYVTTILESGKHQGSVALSAMPAPVKEFAK